MVIRGGVDQVSEYLLPGPFTGRGPQVGLRLGYTPEPKKRIGYSPLEFGEHIFHSRHLLWRPGTRRKRAAGLPVICGQVGLKHSRRSLLARRFLWLRQREHVVFPA